MGFRIQYNELTFLAPRTFRNLAATFVGGFGGHYQYDA